MASDSGEAERRPVRQTEPIVVGDDHAPLVTNFYNTEVYHRADVAHLSGDVFAIGGIRSPDSTDSEALGQGWWTLYNWRTGLYPVYGYFGEGVRTVRVADGCNSGGTRWSWFAWDKSDGVRIARVNSAGTWGATTFIAGARYPTLTRGTNNYGTDRVLLNYERSSGGRSYLYYRFLYCSGTVGTAYAIRSVGDPWVIWHIEAAYNTHLDRWQIFWDEFNGDIFENYADLRTKYLWWNGIHSTSTLVCPCLSGICTPPGCSGRAASENVIEYAPGE